MKRRFLQFYVVSQWLWTFVSNLKRYNKFECSALFLNSQYPNRLPQIYNFVFSVSGVTNRISWCQFLCHKKIIITMNNIKNWSSFFHEEIVLWIPALKPQLDNSESLAQCWERLNLSKKSFCVVYFFKLPFLFVLAHY